MNIQPSTSPTEALENVRILLTSRVRDEDWKTSTRAEIERLNGFVLDGEVRLAGPSDDITHEHIANLLAQLIDGRIALDRVLGEPVDDWTQATSAPRAPTPASTPIILSTVIQDKPSSRVVGPLLIGVAVLAIVFLGGVLLVGRMIASQPAVTPVPAQVVVIQSASGTQPAATTMPSQVVVIQSTPETLPPAPSPVPVVVVPNAEQPTAVSAAIPTGAPTAAPPTEVPTEANPPTSVPAPTAITEPPSAQLVVERFMGAGLSLTDIKPGERLAGSTVPNSYREHLVFTVTEVAPNGGQVFVCDTKKNCDALVAYFNALIAQIGPYVYQSPDGTVVVQLHSSLSADRAALFAQVVASL